VALAFLETAVNWNSLDGEKVDTLLLIVSSSAKQHLQTLSEITFFCRQKDFRRLLKDRAPLEDLLSFIEEAEKNWK
jgi:PTS system nitrogen regulatory IIA component